MREIAKVMKDLPLAGIIKPPLGGTTKPIGEIPYSALVCTEADKEKIFQIITTIAQHGKITLLFKSSELKRMGAEINHVHPLKFLATVFSNLTLKVYMSEIYGDYFKWNGFMDGLGPSLTNHAQQGKLDFYLNDFAKEVEVAPEALKGFIASLDWESFVCYLMNN
jgi:hypothetical protein